MIAKYVRKCNERGDFGYQNVWGSTSRLFDVRCLRPSGHSGKHMAEHTLRIGPTHEKDGLKIDPKSVHSTVLIEWENKA